MPKSVVDAVIDVCREYPEISNFVCPSNEEDGVLVTLEKLFGLGY